MLAVLEASLPAMNQQVADSVFRARNAPLPGPDLPGSKRFWRVKVDPDVDTDSDGSPDWTEFEIVARGTGMLVPGVIGNAFDPDTNGDGIPDGQQLDADLDTTPDAEDPDASDNTAFFPLGPVPRYALFPITNASPPAHALQALQINDEGRVLYENGTWCGGKWTPLVAPTELAYGGYPQTAFGVSINDNDVILGNSSQQVGTLAIEFASVRCFWNTPAADPQLVKSNNNLGTGYAGGLSSSLAFHGDTYQPQLSNDNRFTAHFCHWQAGPNGTVGKEIFESAVWTLPAGGQPLSTHAPIEPSILFHGPGISWGYTVTRNGNGYEDWSLPVKGLVYAPGLLPELPFAPTNVLAYPGSPVMALPSVYEDQAGRALINGAWQFSPAYFNALDISSDGTAIGRTSTKFIAPIYLNGHWTGIERTTPDVPTAWKDSSVKLWDTTPGGWILARRGGNWGDEHAVMLPIRVEGSYVKEFIPGETTTKYVGVDDFSIGSPTPGDAVQDRIWIMAPLNGASKTVTFKVPVESSKPLRLSAPGIDFGNVGGDGYVSTNPSTITLHATTAASGADILVNLKLNDLSTSLSKPLGVKVMKARTVNVTLYKVTKETPNKPDGTPVADNTADQTPDAPSLQKYLNDVFSPQINVRFNVTYAAAPLKLNWDTSGNGSLQCIAPTPGSEQRAILDKRPAGRPQSDIDIFFIGTDNYIDGTDWASSLRIDDTGVGSENKVNACWIVGDALGNREPGKLAQTIGHEIGHVIIGYGHPNQKSGPAHLPGTQHSERLMVSGNANRILRGDLIVKGEWDKAEEWLVRRPEGDN